MTTKFNKFELHSAFRDGKLNEKHFVDLPYLKKEQLQALSSFLGAITREEPLPGKNKPSWLDDNSIKISGTDAYEDGNYWHYHCGPYPESVKLRSMTFNLGMNLGANLSGSDPLSKTQRWHGICRRLLPYT